MRNLLIPMLLVLALLQSCAPANNNLAPDETAKKNIHSNRINRDC